MWKSSIVIANIFSNICEVSVKGEIMNSSNPVFFRNFNIIANNWLSHQPRLYPKVRDHIYFMTMNLDGYVVVRLNSLDYKYKQKHVIPNPDKYCDLFIQQIINPVLRLTLKECGMHGFMYTLMFSGIGQSIIKHVRIEM